MVENNPKASSAASNILGYGVGLKVLLAEDEDAVRAVLTSMLNNAGYQVTAASSGDEALAFFKKDPSFDLVVTDMVMPGRLQGYELANELRELRRDLPIVFMSGYASGSSHHAENLRGEGVRLMKPVSKDLMLKTVENALSPR